jgi:hypothetical protein
LGRQETEDQAGATSAVFYGRDDDIVLIDGLIDRVRDGGAALIIYGEPGI